jgi:hypothetical protein
MSVALFVLGSWFLIYLKNRVKFLQFFFNEKKILSEIGVLGCRERVELESSFGLNWGSGHDFGFWVLGSPERV